MRLWEQNGTGSTRRAHRLVEDYLGDRHLAPAIQAAIEAAVADKLAWDVLSTLDVDMRAAVDLYAVSHGTGEARGEPQELQDLLGTRGSDWRMAAACAAIGDWRRDPVRHGSGRVLPHKPGKTATFVS